MIVIILRTSIPDDFETEKLLPGNQAFYVCE
jgi:hypothetical protein